MKKILTLIVFIFSLTNAKSQVIKPGFLIGVSGLYSMPQGHFKDAYKYGVGGEVFGGFGWGKTYILGTVGYRGYTENISTNAKTLSYIPAKIGVRQFFLLKKIYIQADGGIINVKDFRNVIDQNVFTYDFGAGLRLGGLEAGVFYEGFKLKNTEESLKSINAKVGYSFTL